MLIHETLIEVSWEENQEDMFLFKLYVTDNKKVPRCSINKTL